MSAPMKSLAALPVALRKRTFGKDESSEPHVQGDLVIDYLERSVSVAERLTLRQHRSPAYWSSFQQTLTRL